MCNGEKQFWSSFLFFYSTSLPSFLFEAVFAFCRASLGAQMVKNLPAVQESRVQSLSWEDPLEKEWQPTPVFLPGKSYGWRSLVGYSPWGHKESDTTEQLSLTHSLTASSRSSHIHTLTQYLVKKRIRSKSNNKKDEMTGKLSVNTRNKAYNETRANMK